MKRYYFFLVALLVFFKSYAVTVKIKKFWRHPREPVNRGTNIKTNYPFITGEEFRKICDIIFDETNTTFRTEDVKNGDLVFVKNLYEFLDCFFEKIHPHIKAKYILVSHNGICKKHKECYARYLDNDNIIAWFGKNLTIQHKKAHVIPLGLANHYFRSGKYQLQAMEQLPVEKKHILYSNFNVNTNKKERGEALKTLSHKIFCLKKKKGLYSIYQ